MLRPKQASLEKLGGLVEKKLTAITAVGELKGKISSLLSAVRSLEGQSSSNPTRFTASAQDFVTAYNDLFAFFRETTRAPSGSNAGGALYQDTLSVGFMNSLRRFFTTELVLGKVSPGEDYSPSPKFAWLSDLGIEVSRDGSLSFDQAKLESVLAGELISSPITPEDLATGLTLGVRWTKDESGVPTETVQNTFVNFLSSSLLPKGVLGQRYFSLLGEQRSLGDRKAQADISLKNLESRYYQKYAALDSNLVRMQSVSNSLDSALKGLSSIWNSRR